MKRLSREQFQGVVLGLAIGDALGSKWEGITPDLIRDAGPADQILASELRGWTYSYAAGYLAVAALMGAWGWVLERSVEALALEKDSLH